LRGMMVGVGVGYCDGGCFEEVEEFQRAGKPILEINRGGKAGKFCWVNEVNLYL
jgi:hypothetical protein